jgi:hypothetical protein
MRGQAVYLAPPIEGLKRRYQVQFPKVEGSAAPSEDLLPFAKQLLAGSVEAAGSAAVVPERAAG